VNEKKKNIQKLVEKNRLNKFLELYIIFIKHDPIQKKKDIKNQYEQYISLDPKYPENIILLKQAILKVDSSDIIYSSRYNVFSAF
jgi:hypothetical protein